MAVDFTIGALSSLASTGKTGTTAAATSVVRQTGPSFAETLQNVAQGTLGELQGAERVSLQALSGEADIRDVTDAVMSAEQKLQTAISIRDKIVTAFLEVSRMQI